MVLWFIGAVFTVMGLVFVAGGLHVRRTSTTGLPDDTALLAVWRRTGATPLPDGSPQLRAAAARLKPSGVEDGAPLLGLPDAAGLRLAARLDVDGREVHVGDVWDVTSVMRVNDQPRSATVKLRATSAVALDAAGPTVVVAGEHALSLLLDAAGLRDVQVESEAFNREWRVRCDDRAHAVAVLTPEVQVALQGRSEDVAVEVADGLLTVHQLGRDADGMGLAACVDDLLAVTCGVAAGMRPHTWPDPRPPSWHDAPWVTVDHRPPGMAHPTTGGGSQVFFVLFGAVFALIGLGMLGVAAAVSRLLGF